MDSFKFSKFFMTIVFYMNVYIKKYCRACILGVVLLTVNDVNILGLFSCFVFIAVLTQ